MQSFGKARLDVQIFPSQCWCFFYLLTDDRPLLLQVNDSSLVPLVRSFTFSNAYECVPVDLRAAEIDRKLEGEFPVLLKHWRLVSVSRPLKQNKKKS